MKKKSIVERFGNDADLLGEGFSISPRAVMRALPKLELKAEQQLMLRIMLDYRFSLSGVIPGLRKIGELMNIGYRQTQRWLKSLVEKEKLVKVEGGKGRRYTFDLTPLFVAVRDVLHWRKRKADEPAPIVPAANPDFMYQPLNPEQQELAEELAEANWPESDMAEWGYMPGWRHLDSMSSWRQVLHLLDSEQVKAIRRWLSKLRRGLVLMVAALPGGA